MKCFEVPTNITTKASSHLESTVSVCVTQRFCAPFSTKGRTYFGCKSSIAEIRREPQSDAETEQGNKEPLKLVLIY